jgi:hypothetical protein
MSPSTRDHFRLLAQEKGEPWRTFYKSIQRIRWQSRTDDILLYAGKIVRFWGTFQGHLVGHHWLSWDDFKILQAIENFPKQLMRKILGKLKNLPRPDTAPQISRRFSDLSESWSGELSSFFPPFFAIDDQYRRLVERVVRTEWRPTEEEYAQQICNLFLGLPVREICRIVERVFAPEEHRSGSLPF